MKHINNPVNEICKEVGQFFKQEFKSDLLVSLIYGSWAFGLNRESSDVDIVGICRKHNQKQFKETFDFVKELHNSYGLKLDYEVPYESKLLVDEPFLHRSLFGGGFERNNGQIIIQPIIKTNQFLSSEKMSMRLLLNALTTKNIYCAGNYKYYRDVRHMAFENCVGIFCSAWKLEKFTLNDFVDNLISWKGKKNQFYLGFEDNPLVRSYLKDTFRETLENLLKKGYLIKEKNKFYGGNIQWFREID